MIIPVDKERIMAEFKTKYVEGHFEDEYPKIQKNLNDNKEAARKEIFCAFSELCSKAKKQQEESLKNEIKYIYISYLRTSIQQNSGIYRIDLYDDKWYLDKEECSVNIDLSFVYESLFNYIKELQDRKKEYGRTITEMDVEKIRLKEADKYHKIGVRFLESIVNDLVEGNEYKEMKKSDEIRILAGEYRDEAVLIYETSKKIKDKN